MTRRKVMSCCELCSSTKSNSRISILSMKSCAKRSGNVLCEVGMRISDCGLFGSGDRWEINERRLRDRRRIIRQTLVRRKSEIRNPKSDLSPPVWFRLRRVRDYNQKFAVEWSGRVLPCRTGTTIDQPWPVTGNNRKLGSVDDFFQRHPERTGQRCWLRTTVAVTLKENGDCVFWSCWRFFAFIALADSRATLAMIFVGLGNLFFLFGLLKAQR